MMNRWLFALVGACALVASHLAHAEADPKLWPVMKEAFFEKRDIQDADFIKIEAPRRAESGAQVPVTYSIDSVAAKG
jgi:sulfur-oxidizing protein SoxY